MTSLGDDIDNNMSNNINNHNINNNKENSVISFSIEEFEYDVNNENMNSDKLLEINKLLDEVDKTEINQDEFMIPQMIHYHENCTVKELLLICEYYGFAKDMKSNKCNKEQIIHFLVSFEMNPTNSDIVFKRQNMWFYMNELKSDKFMKRFLLPF